VNTIAARAVRKPETGAMVGMLEAVVAIAAATLVVAAFEQLTSAGNLRVIYLLAVLFITIRRDEATAIATAVLSVLALNFFFVEPRHQLRISHSEDVVALGVFLVAALVVGRLAATARERAEQAEARAQIALVREQEARLIARVASEVLAGASIEERLPQIAAEFTDHRHRPLIRVELSPVPEPSQDEHALRLPTERRSGWVYVRDGVGWERRDAARLAGALARLIDVALERDRLAVQSAEAEAARRADVAKTAVLHAVSHDFRSPLTAITTAASGLRDGELSSDDREDLLSVIESESQRLARMVGDLLDISRIQAGAVDPRTDWCDLQDVVAGAAAQVRAAGHDHPISIELPADLPLVQADASQLERVFSNLIENAVRFSPVGEPVRVSGGSGGGRVTVRVTDRGRGIPATQRAQVFEPFFRGRDSGRGSGLGLAICRGFVEANHGRIQLSSTGGTSFAVSFPAARQPAPSP
jgi:two-component system, OmpR family, sensor histidine kinase KdpD